MCTVTLSEVQELCGANVPGNTALYLANYDDIDVVPAAVDSVISSDLTMAASAVFRRFNFTEDTCQHLEPVNDAGSVDGSITCFFHKDDAIKRNLFKNMINGKFSIIITDGNSLTKFIRKARFVADFDSGTAAGDRNGYTARITYTSAAADVYEGAIPV